LIIDIDTLLADIIIIISHYAIIDDIIIDIDIAIIDYFAITDDYYY